MRSESIKSSRMSGQSLPTQLKSTRLNTTSWLTYHQNGKKWKKEKSTWRKKKLRSSWRPNEITISTSKIHKLWPRKHKMRSSEASMRHFKRSWTSCKGPSAVRIASSSNDPKCKRQNLMHSKIAKKSLSTLLLFMKLKLRRKREHCRSSLIRKKQEGRFWSNVIGKARPLIARWALLSRSLTATSSRKRSVQQTISRHRRKSLTIRTCFQNHPLKRQKKSNL